MFGLAFAWLLLSSVIATESGPIGIIFDAIFMLGLAIFSFYLTEMEVWTLIGLKLGFFLYNYYTTLVPTMLVIMPNLPGANSLDPLFGQILLFVGVPLYLSSILLLSYFEGRKRVQKLHLRERIGKVRI